MSDDEPTYSLIVNDVSDASHLEGGERRFGRYVVTACGQILDRWHSAKTEQPPTCKRCAKKVAES